MRCRGRSGRTMITAMMVAPAPAPAMSRLKTQRWHFQQCSCQDWAAYPATAPQATRAYSGPADTGLPMWQRMRPCPEHGIAMPHSRPEASRLPRKAYIQLVLLVRARAVACPRKVDVVGLCAQLLLPLVRALWAWLRPGCCFRRIHLCCYLCDLECHRCYCYYFRRGKSNPAVCMMHLGERWSVVNSSSAGVSLPQVDGHSDNLILVQASGPCSLAMRKFEPVLRL